MHPNTQPHTHAQFKTLEKPGLFSYEVREEGYSHSKLFSSVSAHYSFSARFTGKLVHKVLHFVLCQAQANISKPIAEK